MTLFGHYTEKPDGQLEEEADNNKYGIMLHQVKRRKLNDRRYLVILEQACDDIKSFVKREDVGWMDQATFFIPGHV